MIGSLFAGISGLSANSTAMSIIGDNIANVNTTAFKSNRASFANILSQSLGGSSGNNIGRGVQFNGQSALWTQGALENTSSPTDFAINGRGFFVLQDENGNEFYTRAGSFQFDKEGSLVDPNGYVVQGYDIDASGNLGSVGNINVPAGSTPPSATDEIGMHMNLDADADDPTAASLTVDCAPVDSDVAFTAAADGLAGNAISICYVDPGAASQPLSVAVNGSDITVSLATDAAGAVTSTAADVAAAVNADPAASALVTAAAEGAGTGLVSATIAENLDGGVDAETYSTTITTYDSLGCPVPLTLTFTRQSQGLWGWQGSVPASVGTTTAGGTIGFDEDGVLEPAASGIANPTISITGLASGAEDLNISWEVLDGSASNGTITGYSSPSVTTFSSQNGYPAGTLQSTQIDEKGVVTGVYTNGQLTPLYQIVMADFQNYDGLAAVGQNLYTESRASGDALLGTAGNGRLGGITPNALEMSNVDLATEFVKMITTQRAFQANSRVITTSDEILKELINLKR